MALPAPRFLNLVYHRMVDGVTAESRAALDRALLGDLSGLQALAARGAATGGSNAPTAPLRAPGRAPRGRDGRHVPGTAPDHIPPPSWWKGDTAAFMSSVGAGQQLGEPAALREPRVPVTRPTVGSTQWS